MRCRLAYSPADATATHYLLLQQIQTGFTLPGFTFLVPAHPGSPGQIPEDQCVCVLYPLLGKSPPAGQTSWRIFVLNSSNNANSHKDVPFRGIVNIAVHLRGQINLKPRF